LFGGVKVVDEMQQGTNYWKRWVEDEMLGNKPFQEIENLKMATKGLMKCLLHIVLYLVKIGVVILKMGCN